MSRAGVARTAAGAAAGLVLVGLGAWGLQPGAVRAPGLVTAAREYRVEHLGDGRLRWRLLDGGLPGGPTTRAEGVLVETRGEPVEIGLNNEIVDGASVAEGATLVTVDVPVAAATVLTLAAERDAAAADVAALEAGGRSGDVAAAQADVAVAEAALQEARVTAERLAALAAEGAAPTWEVDAARLRVSVQEATVAAAKASVGAARRAPLDAEVSAAQGRLAAAEARLGEATARTDATVLRAPFPGTAHHPGGTVLVSVRDEAVTLVHVAVPEARRARVEVGAPVRFQATGGGEAIRGTVLAVAPEAAPSATGAVVWAVARLEGKAPVGATGRVEINPGAWL